MAAQQTTAIKRVRWPTLCTVKTEEVTRLQTDEKKTTYWKRWGPYLSERQWGTVREDYSHDGSCWDSLSHDHARSRAYRWGEDGLLGISDNQCRLCFSLALWNGKDKILKERLFGLTGPQGNHGEDCKECYYYLDSSPTHSYMKALYKYPQAEYPYAWLEDEARRRTVHDPEFELADTGVFNESKYWDVCAEYCKETSNDVLARITVTNRGPDAAEITVLPTLWFRNTWIWGCKHEGCTMKPRIAEDGPGCVKFSHETLAPGHCRWDIDQDGKTPELLFTENETNSKKLFNTDSYTPYVKDAFHRYIVDGEKEAVSPNGRGTKVAAVYKLKVPAGDHFCIRVRFGLDSEQKTGDLFSKENFDTVFKTRIAETDDFYSNIIPARLSKQERNVSRQAYAGLLWTKQFYHYVVKDWLEGDPDQPKPPESRLHSGRNTEWKHMFSKDVLSMPDKWEYPWFASWDLAFHMIPFSRVDPFFCQSQTILLLREWYMSPNGQLPAYEFNFSDVNPPVHCMAAMQAYKMSGKKGSRDQQFLARCFQKLILNFTWWVNRKDPDGKNIFSGGFLGLDNIGVFDRSKPLPTGGTLAQADGTAWMAFFAIVMLAMSFDLAVEDPSYEDMSSKFFEHFISIVDAMNEMSGTGLWDEQDGFYYDQLKIDGNSMPLRIRSMVGLIPLYSCVVLEDEFVKKLPGFKKRFDWFLKHRPKLAAQITYVPHQGQSEYNHLLAVLSRERLVRVLGYLLDENEFLSPFGIRSLSKYHEKNPFVLNVGSETYRVEYLPGESNSYLFGGNSNWRGPIWFPVNMLIVECLERYDYFFGDSLLVECPTGSGKKMRLKDVSSEICRRLCSLFLPDENGRRPCHGDEQRYTDDDNWKDLVLFYEYFDSETGRGCGASHQTGWTALVTTSLERLKHCRDDSPE